MTVYLERQRTFSCAHRYGNASHDANWNARHFGPYTEIHGHNYTASVTLSGELHPVTGIVVNLVDVKEWLREAAEPFENRLVEAASPVMQGRQPSTEEIARILWQRMLPHTAGTPAHLARVRVAESEEVWSEYLGESSVVYVTKVYEFSAAHRLHAEGLGDEKNAALFGKCNRPGGHGHNYVVEVTVKGDVDPETGFAYDLGRLDAAVQAKVLEPMDHRHLNLDVPQFAHLNPTSENLAVVIWKAILPEVGPSLYRVRVHETPRNVFEYMGEE